TDEKTALAAVTEVADIKVSGIDDNHARQMLMGLMKAYQNPTARQIHQLQKSNPTTPFDQAIEPAVEAAKDRARRFVIAKRTGLSRLLEAPAAAQPLTQAVSAAAEEFASQNDWEKLATILDAHQAVMAVNDFGQRATWAKTLARAQRSEAASDFVTAVAAYRSLILVCTDKRMTGFVTTRMKEIGVAHPDALKAEPTTPTRNGLPVTPKL
ncbi:MAG: hypothetical protein ABIZ56_06805, partial [Chthoniobacteraceae bacterium]